MGQVGATPSLSVVVLGTGARWATAERAVAAAVVERGPEHLLIDCGEGTQRQMLASRSGLRRLAAVLITHCHGDHVLGLPGLIATLGDVRKEPLLIAGPAGLRALLDAMVPVVGDPGFPLDVRECAPGTVLPRDG